MKNWRESPIRDVPFPQEAAVPGGQRSGGNHLHFKLDHSFGSSRILLKLSGLI